MFLKVGQKCRRDRQKFLKVEQKSRRDRQRKGGAMTQKEELKIRVVG